MSDLAVRRAVIVGAVTPLTLGLAGVGWQLAAMGDLPATVAIHFGSNGADGFAPAWLVPVITFAMAVCLPLLLTLTSLPALRKGERGFILRFLIAMSAGLSALLSVTLTGMLLIQRGLEHAADAPSVLPVMGWGFAAGALVGVVGWFAQPKHESAPRSAEQASPLPLAPGQRAVFFGRAQMSTLPLVALVSAVALLGVTALWVGLIGDVAAAAIFGGAAVLVGFLVGTMAVFTVRIDAQGLTVRSVARIIRMRVPAADVESVVSTHVNGLAQYGGFGLRQIPGATAVVLRSGPAIEVTRRSGRRFVVTMDEADAAASVLAAVALAAAQVPADGEGGHAAHR